MTVGARILATRKEKGLSQRAISSEHVTVPYISRIENGQREPSVKAIRKIAEKLGVDAVWLETGRCSVTAVGEVHFEFHDPSGRWVIECDSFSFPGNTVELPVGPAEIRVTELAPDDPRLA